MLTAAKLDRQKACADGSLIPKKDKDKGGASPAAEGPPFVDTGLQENMPSDKPRRPLEEAEDLGYLTFPTDQDIEFKVASTTFQIPHGSIIGTDWVSIAVGGSQDALKVQFFLPMTRDPLDISNFAGAIVMVFFVDHEMASPVARFTPLDAPPEAAFDIPGEYDPATQTVKVTLPREKAVPTWTLELEDQP